jgi:hypothetical protein
MLQALAIRPWNRLDRPGRGHFFGQHGYPRVVLGFVHKLRLVRVIAGTLVVEQIARTGIRSIQLLTQLRRQWMVLTRTLRALVLPLALPARRPRCPAARSIAR